MRETACRLATVSACTRGQATACRSATVSACTLGPATVCTRADKREPWWWRDTGAASWATHTQASCCSPARSPASASRKRADCRSLSDRQRPRRRAPWWWVCRWAAESSSDCKPAADKRASLWCSGCKRAGEEHTRGSWACTRVVSSWCWARMRETASRPAPAWSAEVAAAARKEWCWA